MDLCSKLINLLGVIFKSRKPCGPLFLDFKGLFEYLCKQKELSYEHIF